MLHFVIIVTKVYKTCENKANIKEVIKIGEHISHQMKLTSLLVRFGNYTEEQYNSAFRNEMERKIIKIHSCMPDGLTDEELGDILKVTLDKPNLDTDVYRPRRSDLSKEKKGKRIRPSILIDSGNKRRNRFNRLCIVWVLNEENMCRWIQ